MLVWVQSLIFLGSCTISQKVIITMVALIRKIVLIYFVQKYLCRGFLTSNCFPKTVFSWASPVTGVLVLLPAPLILVHRLLPVIIGTKGRNEVLAVLLSRALGLNLVFAARVDAEQKLGGKNNLFICGRWRGAHALCHTDAKLQNVILPERCFALLWGLGDGKRRDAQWYFRPHNTKDDDTLFTQSKM